MTIAYSLTVKNTRMTDVRDAIDGGPAAGILKLYTIAYGTLLVELVLSDPCGVVAGGVLTFSDMPKSAIAIGTGVAAIARLTDSNDTMVAEGLTVGIGGTDIVIDNPIVNTGQTVNLTSAQITHG